MQSQSKIPRILIISHEAFIFQTFSGVFFVLRFSFFNHSSFDHDPFFKHEIERKRSRKKKLKESAKFFPKFFFFFYCLISILIFRKDGGEKGREKIFKRNFFGFNHPKQSVDNMLIQLSMRSFFLFSLRMFRRKKKKKNSGSFFFISFIKFDILSKSS